MFICSNLTIFHVQQNHIKQKGENLHIKIFSMINCHASTPQLLSTVLKIPWMNFIHNFLEPQLDVVRWSSESINLQWLLVQQQQNHFWTFKELCVALILFSFAHDCVILHRKKRIKLEFSFISSHIAIAASRKRIEWHSWSAEDLNWLYGADKKFTEWLRIEFHGKILWELDKKYIKLTFEQCVGV